MEVDSETTQSLTQPPWQEAAHWPWRSCWWLYLGHGGALLVCPGASCALTPRRSNGGTEPCIPSLMCLVPQPVPQVLSHIGQCHGCHSCKFLGLSTAFPGCAWSCWMQTAGSLAPARTAAATAECFFSPSGGILWLPSQTLRPWSHSPRPPVSTLSRAADSSLLVS